MMACQGDPQASYCRHVLYSDIGNVVQSRDSDSKKGKAIPLQAWTGPEGSR